jgi:luciferase family oxidoreductase group 1
LIALSVLDQSPVPNGSTAAEALHDTVVLASHAERLGYRRYWLAEHHNTASLAGSAPEVLTGYVASQTSSIRVGAGGVLLSHYSALKVAETFNVLSALFPGRIDLGLARADGADAPAVAALQGARGPVGEAEYRDRLIDLLAFLEPIGDESRRLGGIRAMPEGVAPPEVWVLGSSSHGAALAATLGLPFCFAHFISPRFAVQILAAYRGTFQPSSRCPQPRAIVAVSVICADTDADAELLAASDDVWHLRAEGGDRGPLLSAPEAACYSATALERELITQHRTRRILGSPSRVHAALVDLAASCCVDELVVRTICHDPSARLRSYQLLAQAFGLQRCP